MGPCGGIGVNQGLTRTHDRTQQGVLDRALGSGGLEFGHGPLPRSGDHPVDVGEWTELGHGVLQVSDWRLHRWGWPGWVYRGGVGASWGVAVGEGRMLVLRIRATAARMFCPLPGRCWAR